MEWRRQAEDAQKLLSEALLRAERTDSTYKSMLESADREARVRHDHLSRQNAFLSEQLEQAVMVSSSLSCELACIYRPVNWTSADQETTCTGSIFYYRRTFHTQHGVFFTAILPNPITPARYNRLQEILERSRIRPKQTGLLECVYAFISLQ